MKAGRLNQRITIQSLSATQDEMGQPVQTWTDVCTVWAGLSDVSGREYIASGGIQNTAQTKISIRYRSGLVAAMRVLHGADKYNIEAVLGQDKRSLLLMCSRIQ